MSVLFLVDFPSHLFCLFRQFSNESHVSVLEKRGVSTGLFCLFCLRSAVVVVEVRAPPREFTSVRGPWLEASTEGRMASWGNFGIMISQLRRDDYPIKAVTIGQLAGKQCS